MDSLPKKQHFPKIIKRMPSEFLEEVLIYFKEINPSSRAVRFTEANRELLSNTLDRYGLVISRFLCGVDVSEDLYLLSKKLKQISPNSPYSGDEIARDVLARWIDDIYNQCLIP